MIKKINLIAGGNDLAFATILRRQVRCFLMPKGYCDINNHTWIILIEMIAERLRIAHLRARGLSGFASILSRRESDLICNGLED